MSGEPSRHTQVSRSPSPIPIAPRRWRSLAAGIASGSPPSSPVYAHAHHFRSGRAPGSLLESDVLTASQSSQVAQSQGTPPPNPSATSSGCRGTSAPVVAKRLSPMPSPDLSGVDEDIVMESASSWDLTRAIKDLVTCFPPPRDAAERRVNECKVKIDAATLDGTIADVFGSDYRGDVRNYLKQYRTEVETLAQAHSMLDKLRKHRVSKTFPVSMNSIKVPSIQFSRAFLNAPAEESKSGSYNAPNDRSVGFESVVSTCISWVKEKVLADWISKTEIKVTFLEGKALAVKSIVQFKQVVDSRHVSLKAHYDYLIGQLRYNDLIRDVEYQAAVGFSLASLVVSKVNALVNAEEDKKLASAIKKMALDKPAVAAAAQAPPNDLTELRKLVVDLTKKVDLQSKKVSDCLYTLLCVCADALLLTPPLLEQLAIDTVEVGWEEVGRQERQGEEREVRTNWKEKGQKGKGRPKGDLKQKG